MRTTALRESAAAPSADLATWPHRSAPSCSLVFRQIANDCIAAIRTKQPRAIAGDADAVHTMRIELTRLRAAALFFAPWVDEAEWEALDEELDWLNSVLGKARNVDVMIAYSTRKPYRDWAAPSRRKLARSQGKVHRRLAKELRSARYGRIIPELDRCLRNGPSPGNGRAASPDQSNDFYERRLRAWRADLSRKGRHVGALGRKEQHRLRIQSKNYRYVVESLLALNVPLSREDFSFCDVAKRMHQDLGDLRDLRRLHKSVGRRPPHYRRHRRKLTRRVERLFRRDSSR